MSKYTQHTPGPWVIDSEGQVTDLGGRVIAPLVHGHNVPSLAFPRGSGQHLAEDDGGEANARLIAAAPDLLEALRYIAGLDTSQDASPAQCSAVAVAMDAIAKAEGGAA